jgi:hypothetical protein
VEATRILQIAMAASRLAVNAPSTRRFLRPRVGISRVEEETLSRERSFRSHAYPAGLHNVPLFSCGRVQKGRKARRIGKRRASPWYFTTGER